MHEALDSILAQTYKWLDVIVVDDGSTDGTAAVLQRYGDKVKCIRQDNAGPAAARNTGVHAAQGQVIAFLDSDDKWAPEKVSRQMNCFNQNPKLGICVTHVQNFWEDELASERADLQNHRRVQPVPGYASPAMMARRSVFETVGMFDEQLQHADDIDWFIRARQAGIEIVLLPDVLLYRRMHVNNRSRHRATASTDEHLKILKAAIDRKRGNVTTAQEKRPHCQGERHPKFVFAAMELAFERARRDLPERIHETSCRFGGCHVRIRIGGSSLATQVMRPFSHLAEAQPRDEQEELKIDLWDETETGIDPQEGHCVIRDFMSTSRPKFTASTDGRFVMHTYRRSVTTFDRLQRRIYGWFAGDQLDLADLSRPIYAPLLLWNRDRGIQSVHAAAVAIDGVGVLFGGPAGCGKSASALSCVCQGFSYLGDDYVGLEDQGDGAFAGHSLYNSAHVDAYHLASFPELAPHAIRVAPQSKAVVFITQAFPGRAARTAPIDVLMLPRITNEPKTRVRTATKGQALMRLAPSSLLWLPHAREAGIDLMARFVESVPCYWLDLGRDLNQIAPRVQRLLQEVTASCQRR